MRVVAGFGWALAGGFLLACGGATRIGNTNDKEPRGSGGAPADDSGTPPPSTGGRMIVGRGGAIASGGRATGGFFSSGGRIATGGTIAIDASIETGGSGGARVFDAGSDPARNHVPPGHVCERLSTIQCAGEAFCCPNPGTFDACKQGMLGACQQYMDAWSANPMAGYDLDRAFAAFTEFEKRASVCDTSLMAWALGNDGFRGVARGTVPPGERCLSIDAGATRLEDVALLGSCADPESYACMFSDNPARWVCTPRGATGDRCFTDMNCLEGLYCDMARPQSRCAPRKPNGAPCNWLLECESMSCTNGLCGPATLESVYCLAY